jgi:hypothetical protein
MRLTHLGLVLAASAWISLPAAAAPQIVRVWETQPTDSYDFLQGPMDLNADGILDLVMTSDAGHGTRRFEVRSAATGQVQAQSNSGYEISNPVITDLDDDGRSEIVFVDRTSHLVCVEFTGAPGPLFVRWDIQPFPGFSFFHFFADFDGNGHQYIVAQVKDSRGDDLYKVYTRQGQYFSEYLVRDSGVMTLTGLAMDDFDSDLRNELMLIYRDNSQFRDYMILLESSAPVPVEEGPRGQSGMALSAGVPNPARGDSRIGYTVPTQGRVSLRVYDVTGREVKTLVDGNVPAGSHEATWDGRDAKGQPVRAGAYFYELNAAGRKVGKQLIRLR